MRLGLAPCESSGWNPSPSEECGRNVDLRTVDTRSAIISVEVDAAVTSIEELEIHRGDVVLTIPPLRRREGAAGGCYVSVFVLIDRCTEPVMLDPACARARTPHGEISYGTFGDTVGDRLPEASEGKPIRIGRCTALQKFRTQDVRSSGKHRDGGFLPGNRPGPDSDGI